MEKYQLFFQWFVGLNPDDAVWTAAVFSENRRNFFKADVSRRFSREVAALLRNKDIMSDEHFTVDGTPTESLGCLKNFKPRHEELRSKFKPSVMHKSPKSPISAGYIRIPGVRTFLSP